MATTKARPWAAMYDRPWRRRRAAHLALYPLCSYCQTRGLIEAATVADHVTPHRDDPVLFKGPLQSLCTPCHSGTKQQFEATGTLRGTDISGVPTGPNAPLEPRAKQMSAAAVRVTPCVPTLCRSPIGAYEPTLGPAAGTRAQLMSGGARSFLCGICFKTPDVVHQCSKP